MRGGVGCNLGQVRDAEYLKLPSQLAELRAYRVGHASSDSGIDLVEHKRLAQLIGRRDALERQHHPRKFAPRGDPGQRPQLFPGIRSQVKLGLVEPSFGPARIRFDRVDETQLASGLWHCELPQTD